MFSPYIVISLLTTPTLLLTAHGRPYLFFSNAKIMAKIFKPTI